MIHCFLIGGFAKSAGFWSSCIAGVLLQVSLLQYTYLQFKLVNIGCICRQEWRCFKSFHRWFIDPVLYPSTEAITFTQPIKHNQKSVHLQRLNRILKPPPRNHNRRSPRRAQKPNIHLRPRRRRLRPQHCRILTIQRTQANHILLTAGPTATIPVKREPGLRARVVVLVLVAVIPEPRRVREPGGDGADDPARVERQAAEVEGYGDDFVD